jgi:hypothetical protein
MTRCGTGCRPAWAMQMLLLLAQQPWITMPLRLLPPLPL